MQCNHVRRTFALWLYWGDDGFEIKIMNLINRANVPALFIILIFQTLKTKQTSSHVMCILKFCKTDIGHKAL